MSIASGCLVLSCTGSLVDGWTRLRDACAHALLWMPTPLPAFEAPAQLQALIQDAVGLLSSPRVRESDAGAQLLAIAFRKHVVHLGWSIRLRRTESVMVTADSKQDGAASAMLFAESLLQLIEVNCCSGCLQQ